MTTKTEDYSLPDAVSTAFGEVEQLTEELSSWLDNMPEGLRNGDKASTIEEAISALEGVSEVDVPECAEQLRCTVTKLKRKASRATRANWAAELYNAAAGAARSRIEELNELEFSDDDEGEPEPEGESTEPKTEADRDTMVSELDSFADECENQGSDLEGIEFPGMY